MVVVMMGENIFWASKIDSMSHILNILSMANTFEISSSIFTYTARPFFTQAFLVLFFPPQHSSFSPSNFWIDFPPLYPSKKRRKKKFYLSRNTCLEKFSLHGKPRGEESVWGEPLAADPVSGSFKCNGANPLRGGCALTAWRSFH